MHMTHNLFLAVSSSLIQSPVIIFNTLNECRMILFITPLGPQTSKGVRHYLLVSALSLRVPPGSLRRIERHTAVVLEIPIHFTH